MRDKALIAFGMILLSTAVQAGETRSLSLSTGEAAATPRSADAQRAADATTPAIAQPAPAQIAPRIVTGDPPSRRQGPAAPRRRAARAPKPPGGGWTRSRIISELHRRGIYW